MTESHASAPESPSQAPEVGRLGRLLGSFHFTGAFWFRVHALGVRSVPSVLATPIIAVFTLVFFFAVRGVADAIAANLEAVLGRCGPVTRHVRVLLTLWNFAWCQTEHYERLLTRRRFSADGREHGETPAADEGIVMATAHVGMWEIGAWLAPILGGERHIHIIRDQELDPAAQEMVETMLAGAASGHATLHFGKARDPGLAAALLGALRRGDVVALQADRPAAGGGRTATVELFGRPLELPVGPIALARAAACPVVPVFFFRSGRRRAEIVVREPFRVARTQSPTADLEAAMQRLAEEVEWAIRRRPFQWFCFRRLWPTEP